MFVITRVLFVSRRKQVEMLTQMSDLSLFGSMVSKKQNQIVMQRRKVFKEDWCKTAQAAMNYKRLTFTFSNIPHYSLSLCTHRSTCHPYLWPLQITTDLIHSCCMCLPRVAAEPACMVSCKSQIWSGPLLQTVQFANDRAVAPMLGSRIQVGWNLLAFA